MLLAPSNCSLSTSNVVFGAVVTAKCVIGYMFPDKNVSKVLECIETNEQEVQWNDTLKNCEGKTRTGTQIGFIEGPLATHLIASAFTPCITEVYWF